MVFGLHWLRSGWWGGKLFSGQPQYAISDGDALLARFAPLIGEFVWHSLTADPNIVGDSINHFQQVVAAIDCWCTTPPRTILEVASYAHITGYMLKKEFNAEVSLLDISASTLGLGRKIAEENGYTDFPRLFAGDFHHLPFEDNSFDVVYISSALHHSNAFKTVGRELQRVLAPKGILILLNEPFRRDACFYKFRTNRISAFTEFEKKLDELGIIRTIAEPHLGSRDEILFGMVENQEIPIGVLLDLFAEECDILTYATDSEARTGALEKNWLNWAVRYGENRRQLGRVIAADLQERVGAAAKFTSATTRGLGFALPVDEEIDQLGREIAERLHRLPVERKDSGYLAAYSALIGGSISLVAKKFPAKKKAIPRHKPLKPLAAYPLLNHVCMTYPEDVSQVLLQNRSLIPVLSLANTSRLQEFFPADTWTVGKEENNLVTISLNHAQGRICLPSSAKRFLLLLRINFAALLETGPYCLEITSDSCEEFQYPVYQEEAILYRQIIAPDKNTQGELRVSISPLVNNGGASFLPYRPILIYYAGLFAL